MKKIRVKYTAHASKNNICQMQADFQVSDETASALRIISLPTKRVDISGTGSCFNLKTALYWNARLADCFFDMDDSILSIKEVKR